ncbi:MAG: acyl-CoA dehydrogenase family protein [Myxococcales bacterium]|nr:acyl-CoA dehydrogenase family protein [Myxococcales bacterium]
MVDWRELDLFHPTPEHRLLADTLREFVAREVEPRAAEHDRAERFDSELFRKAGALGLLGVTIPEAWGGAGLDATAAVQVFEALASSDPGFAFSVLAHSILYAHGVAANGSDEQRARLLPKAVSGEWLCGMAMTEPEGGTDVMAMRTRAERDGDDYVVTGTKTFITNGGTDDGATGDAFVVYAATGRRGITPFVVERGMEGFALGQKWRDKLGVRQSFTAELLFDGVRVPAANRLGEEGFGAMAMIRTLEIERLTLAALSLGIAQRSLDEMVAHASERRSFGVPIREHGQVQRYIGEAFAEYRAARSLVYDAARRLDPASSTSRLDGDAAKLFASQAAKRAADAAIQVLGGYGYMGEYVVSRLWRDAKIVEIAGGTLEAHHRNIALGLARAPGLVRE